MARWRIRPPRSSPSCATWPDAPSRSASVIFRGHPLRTEKIGLKQARAWDLPYASGAIEQARYSFSDNEVKQYFPLPRVLDGLFKLIERMFACRSGPTRPRSGIRRCSSSDRIGRPAGRAVLPRPLRARAKHGRMDDDCRGRTCTRQRPARLRQGPAADVGRLSVCNFQAPVVTTPRLLTHDDITPSSTSSATSFTTC